MSSQPRRGRTTLLVVALLMFAFAAGAAYWSDSYTLFGVLAIPAITFLCTTLGGFSTRGDAASAARIFLTVILFVVLPLLTFTNETLLLACGAILLGFALVRSANMIAAARAATPPTGSDARRLLRYGVVLGLGAPLLFVFAHALAGFDPHGFENEARASLESFVAYERSYADLQNRITGVPRFQRLTPADVRTRWFVTNQGRAGLKGTADVDLAYAADNRSFAIFVTPSSKRPYRPFNIFVTWPVYRGDGNGEIRRCSVHTAPARCSRDAPLQKRVGTLQQEMARGGVSVESATQWLDAMRDPTVGDALLAALRSSDPYVRLGAVEQLGKRRDARAIEPLIALLHDPDRDYRWTASRWQVVVALGNFPLPRVEDELISVLENPHEDINMRAFAASTLGKFSGERAMTALIRALDSPEGRIAGSAAAGLATLGDARAVGPLLKLLAHPDRVVRANAAGALVQFDDPRIVPALESAAAHDPDEFFRRNAAENLQRLKERRAAR
jgi:hypothetical protein